MQCPYCKSKRVCRFGHNPCGTQRYRCRSCRKTHSERRRAVGNMYLSLDKACQAARLLVEGNSISSTARCVGIEATTVASLLCHFGRGCKDLLIARVRNVTVSHLELDEIWTFVQKKQRRVSASDPATVGDAYCFIALDRDSRLVTAWHLGKRDGNSTLRFILKVRQATAPGKFQISTDGWEAYEYAIELGLSDRASYARIVKVTRPGRVEAVLGSPDLSQTETTYIERFNGTLRQWCRRFTRKTYAFSKKWEMLESALALGFAHYNFCRIHRSLRVTPAMESGLTTHPWSISELLERACLG